MSNQFIQILPDDEPLVTDSIDNTWDKDHIVLPLVFGLVFEDDFDYFLGNAEKLDTFIDEVLFEIGNKFFNLV